MLGSDSEFGKVGETFEAVYLLAHSMVLYEEVSVAVEEVPVEGGEWAGVIG